MGLFDDVFEVLVAYHNVLEKKEKKEKQEQNVKEKIRTEEKEKKAKRLDAKRAKDEKLAEFEKDNNKIVLCSECNGSLKKKDVYYYVDIPYQNLENYCGIKKWESEGICGNCKEEIEDRFSQTAEESLKRITTYPSTYKGKKYIDYSTVKKDIQSGYYMYKDLAYNELRYRAYLEGYDIVFDLQSDFETCGRPSNSGHGTYYYKVYSVTGSFAKKLNSVSQKHQT